MCGKVIKTHGVHLCNMRCCLLRHQGIVKEDVRVGEFNSEAEAFVEPPLSSEVQQEVGRFRADRMPQAIPCFFTA